MATTTPLINIAGLADDYAGVPVLTLERWQVPAGDHGVILGPSGSGKTTLLMLLAGLRLARRGVVEIDGQNWRTLTPAQRDRHRGRTLGLVFQGLHLVQALSARDNLRLARWLAGLPPDDQRVDTLIAALGLTHRATARPAHLSRGEAQRVAIARALVNRPALVLADEPTSSLDDSNCERVMDLLMAQTTASGATLIVTTHDARVAKCLPVHLRLALAEAACEIP